jgi:hypothetical protein
MEVLMAAFVTSNTISSVKKQLAVNNAILEAIGNREGVWRASIAESSDKPVWLVTVKGPNGFGTTQRFEGKDCRPAHIGSCIREALDKSDEELSIALAELVKEGVMFTSEVRPDGNVEYVIDRVKLSGDDVKYLGKRGALTRRGIEQYLVARK